MNHYSSIFYESICLICNYFSLNISCATLTCKVENLISDGVPQCMELGTTGHLFERIHGKNPFLQLNELENRNLGTQDYKIVEIF